MRKKPASLPERKGWLEEKHESRSKKAPRDDPKLLGKEDKRKEVWRQQATLVLKDSDLAQIDHALNVANMARKGSIKAHSWKQQAKSEREILRYSRGKLQLCHKDQEAQASSAVMLNRRTQCSCPHQRGSHHPSAALQLVGTRVGQIPSTAQLNHKNAVPGVLTQSWQRNHRHTMPF